MSIDERLYWYRASVADEDDVSAYTRPVVDGDTLYLWIDRGHNQFTLEKVRLTGIDTPERGEDGFEEATDALRRMVEDADTLVIDSKEEGKYGRPVAELYGLYDANWRNLNEAMVERGYAERSAS